MIYFYLYIIGYIAAFICCHITKKEDAQYMLDQYNRRITNKEWLIDVILVSLLSWIYVLCFFVYKIFILINRNINKINCYKSYKKWANTPIIK